jgi:hypothetical protein
MAKDKFDSKKWFNSMDSIVEMKGKVNEGNSYYDLKKQYYEIADNHGHGGLLSTLHDIKKKADTDHFNEIGGIENEIKIWTAIHKLVNKSKLGKIL